MLRFLGEALSALFFFLVVRSAVSAVWQGFRGTMSVPNPAYEPPRKETSNDIRTSGELHKDPTCGTFVLIDTAYMLAEDGITYYFCSKDCREKFQAGRRQNKWGKNTTARS
jgi:YHS domain-containing protein